MLFLALALLADAPVEGVFGDWAVACDNGRACTAIALQPMAWAGEEPTQAGIVRDPDPDANVNIDVKLLGASESGARVLIDGRQAAVKQYAGTAWQPYGEPGLALARAMAGGKVLTVVAPGGKILAHLSLDGLGDALRYMDALQGRIGTVSAVMEPGDEPASRVLPLPERASFVALRPPRGAAPPIAPALRAAMARQAECEAGGKIEAHRIDARTLLVLLPCGSGAYNSNVAAFIVRDGKAAPAPFDIGPGWDAGNLLSNARWDAATGMLHHFDKGRGIGDCGTRQVWAWDGARYRLVQAERMEECRGAMEWPMVYEAEFRWKRE